MIFRKLFYVFLILWFAKGQCQHNVILEALDAPSGPPQFTIVNCGSPVGYLADGLPANSADIAAIQPILVNVTVPGPYHFTTNTINGVVFSASGTFTAAGTQTVNLIGSGIPTDYTVDNNMFNYTVTNTTGTNAGSCSFPRRVYVPDQNYTGNIRNDGRHRFLYRVITGPGNKHWLQTNLGAHYNQVGHPNFNPDAAATNADDYLAFGSLFQVGRNSDGHELLTWTSATSATGLSPTATPAPAANIIANTGLYYVSTNASRQTGVTGNNYGTAIDSNGRIIIGPGMPCPSGFVVAKESDYITGYNAGNAFWLNNALKLIAPRVYRDAANGSLIAYNRRLIRGNDPSNYPFLSSAAPEFVIEGGILTTPGNTTHWDRRSVETYFNDNNNNTFDGDPRASLDGYPIRCVKP